MAQASMKCPVYTANLYTADGKKYRLKGITTDLTIGTSKDELAEKVSITFANVMVGGKKFHNYIALRNKIYVYANTGNGAKEVFRGIVWQRDFQETSDVREITLICYDRLIYLQNCKDNLYVKKGSRTDSVIKNLAKKWGVKIRYNYRSISHGKLVYRSEMISDIIISLLKKVKKKTGKGYAIRCEKGVMIIEEEAKNSTVYKIESKDNSISTNYSETMDDMVTKVKIVKAETKKTKKYGEKETGKYTTVANVKGNTKKYGTMQDIVEKGSDEKMSEAKKEAKQILNEKGKPNKEISVTAVDNPWIQKGHKVYINSGTLKNNYIVKGIEHDAATHTMTLEVKKA